jgi:hypothetical protein
LRAGRFRWNLARVRAGQMLLLVLVLAGCSCTPDAQPPAPGSAAAPPTFSRPALGPPPGDAGGAGEPPVPSSAEPGALDEILAAAPRSRSGGVDRSGAIGTDTGVPGDAGPGAAPAPVEQAKTARIHVGKVVIEPGMSSPTIERAARAQLYWPLVQRCRDADGGILPAEVVHLTFHLDADGYVIPATILAVPKEPRFADAARCMARELSMATFRAPAAARGLPQNVSTDVPSVD